ncbi:putative serine protease PepD [Catenulispora sp. EB89]|uniref:trypsin-like peptidase domain-containing protein n=1 Tax=Catenulispora sp. EB89 TaxID=3156257 RepID=UPI003519A49A
MNEPSSNAGGSGGLGDNGANEAAQQDVRESFGANPAASGGSGAQDPQAGPAQQDAVPPTAAAQPAQQPAPQPAPADNPTLIQPTADGPDQTLIQPAVPATPTTPDPAAGGYQAPAPATAPAQAQSGPIGPGPQAPQTAGQPQPQPGAAFGPAGQAHQAQQAGLGAHLGPGPTPPPNWAAPSDGTAFPPYTPPGAAPQRTALSGGKMLVAVALIAGLIGGGIGTAVTYAAKDNNSSSSSAAASTRSPLNTNNTALSTPGSVTQVAAAVMPSVVDIQVSTANGSGDEGTGIIYSSDGLIVTNNHVIAAANTSSQSNGNSNGNNGGTGGTGGNSGGTGGNSGGNGNPFGGGSGGSNGGSSGGNSASGPATITVTFNDGRTASAHIVGTEPLADLAVIKVDGVSGLTKASFADSKNLAVGQQVVAIGSPLGLTSTVTSGIVSALNRPVETQAEDGSTVVLDAVQTDAAINPGNSGGPLVDMQGNVIGINSAIASNSQNSGGLGGSSGQAGSIGLGFAIPISEALPIVDALAQGKPAQIASLGVAQNGQSDTTTRTAGGYKVQQVTSGAPADKAGLKAGDVITKIGDRLVYSYQDVAAAVRSHRPGDTVPITYTRNGSSTTVNVTLGVLATQPTQ